MNSATAPILAALLVQLGLGLAVFQANPRRKSNQCFLLLCLTICAWLGTLYFAISATSNFGAELSIRGASVAFPLIVIGFNLLRLSIREDQKGFRGLLDHSKI